jgi:isopropylmalate/homocitrate/citramalate synthase
MERRTKIIRELIKEYLKLEDTNLNKNELKKALKYELSLIIKEEEENISDYLLEGWMNNELRTELEESFGLHSKPADEYIVGTIKSIKNA